MSLGASLQIGRSGLLTSKTAMEVTGNNLANLATPGYHRQRVTLAPYADQRIGENLFVGRGVQMTAINRVVDDALEARLRSATSDTGKADVLTQMLQQVESIENELSGTDLSTRLSAFFDAWSNLADNPQDRSLRTLVTQEAGTLSSFINDLDTQFKELRTQTDRSMGQVVDTVNDLLQRVERVNQQIIIAEGGAGEGASGLRDQRDTLLSELSTYLDISTVEQPNGATDIFVGSLPIMLNGQSRGIELRQRSIDGDIVTDVVIADDKSPLDIRSGQLGALMQFRTTELPEAMESLDRVASQLIWEVNRIHSQSQTLDGMTTVTGAARVSDTTATLNDLDATELAFAAQHGSFQIHLTHPSSGERTTTTIQVDLDGINPAGDTTLDSLAAQIDAVAGISASITPDGRLRITADGNDSQVSFSDDTSGVLAALGINTFFTGGKAFDMGVNATVAGSPGMVAAARDHLAGDNQGALLMAQLRDRPVDALSGQSLAGYWNQHVEDLAIRTAQAQSQQESTAVVHQSLSAQQQSLSGVNADEETIDLIKYQRAYQASARFISVIDEMMQTLLGLV